MINDYIRKKRRFNCLIRVSSDIHVLPVVLGEVLNVAAGILLEDVVGVYKKRDIPMRRII